MARKKVAAKKAARKRVVKKRPVVLPRIEQVRQELQYRRRGNTWLRGDVAELVAKHVPHFDLLSVTAGPNERAYEPIAFGYEGRVWISAGCRVFTLDEAIVHWWARWESYHDHNPTELRALYMVSQLVGQREVSEHTDDWTSDCGPYFDHFHKFDEWLKEHKLIGRLPNDPRKR